MLVELNVRNLGVIESTQLVVGSEMTVLTGETGAGKTMLVEAVLLLMGQKADPQRIRPGTDEAVVEARFVGPDDEETVVRRVIPKSRSRAYINGEAVTVTELRERVGALIEVCGQHAHQQLMSPTAQRDALDRFGSIDSSALQEAKETLRAVLAERDAMGGDPRARARELDLLRYQLSELDAAQLSDPDEADRLAEEFDQLHHAADYQQTMARVVARLSEDGGLLEELASVASQLQRVPRAAPLFRQLDQVCNEVAEVARDSRVLAEECEADPQRLDFVLSRRAMLVDLYRKYGDTIEELIEVRERLRGEVRSLEQWDERAASLDLEVAAAQQQLADARHALLKRRSDVAPALAAQIMSHLEKLGLGDASIEIDLTEVDSNPVRILFSANRGMPARPLEECASGGELSRLSLALYLVLSPQFDTVIFDEVDAGIGGTVAGAVGAALASVGRQRQVLVVTHLAQIASQAAHHFVVSKDQSGLARSSVREVSDEDRVVELSRMLSGSPDSALAQDHARELLAR